MAREKRIGRHVRMHEERARWGDGCVSSANTAPAHYGPGCLQRCNCLAGIHGYCNFRKVARGKMPTLARAFLSHPRAHSENRTEEGLCPVWSTPLDTSNQLQAVQTPAQVFKNRMRILQSAQFCWSESEQNAIRTESYWPAARIRLNGWLRVRLDCVLFQLRQAQLSRLQYPIQSLGLML